MGLAGGGRLGAEGREERRCFVCAQTLAAAPHTTFIYHCARAATWLVHACTAASCMRQVVNRLKKESVFETIRDYGVNYDKVDKQT